MNVWQWKRLKWYKWKGGLKGRTILYFIIHSSAPPPPGVLKFLILWSDEINHSNFENATKCLNKSWWYLLKHACFILKLKDFCNTCVHFQWRKQTLVDTIGILSALRMRGLHDKRHLLAKLRIAGRRELAKMQWIPVWNTPNPFIIAMFYWNKSEDYAGVCIIEGALWCIVLYPQLIIRGSMVQSRQVLFNPFKMIWFAITLHFLIDPSPSILRTSLQRVKMFLMNFFNREYYKVSKYQQSINKTITSVVQLQQ